MSGLKRSLNGCVEMALFMPDPGQWFDNTNRELWRSFAPLFFTLAVYSFAMYRYDFSKGNYSAIAEEYVLMFAVGLFYCLLKYPVFVFLAWISAKIINAEGSFRHFLIVNNWFHLVSLVALFPVWWQLLLGMSGEQILPMFMTSLFYCYLGLATMASKVLKVSIEVSALLPLSSLIANGMVLFFFTKIGGMWIF